MRISSETITFRRSTFLVEILDDSDHGAPWENEDGHGPISDFERMRDWCLDRWHYVGVKVTRLDRHGNQMRHESDSLWGVESDCHDYHATVAAELAANINAMRAAARKAAA